MMNISKICFIGADEFCDLDAVFDLQELTSVPIEIGVLYSPKKSKQKHKRYPSEQFILDFAEDYRTKNTAIHLCGDAINQYMTNTLPKYLMDYFKRVQLNFAIKDFDVEKLTKYIIDIFDHTQIPVILQHNKSKAQFIDTLVGKLNLISENIDWPIPSDKLHILFDASGGLGRVATKFSPVYENYTCGYAGGIHPDTVEDILEHIYRVNKLNPFYIDMESGIRTNDEFDIEKCKRIIDIVNKYV